MKAKLITVLALAVALGVASAAMADEFSFSFNGGGVSASGIFTASPGASLGVYEITSITGTFSDSNVGVSGAITGLYQPVSYVSDTLATPGIAFTTGGLSYDDLFYPAGDSPAICYDLINGVPTLTYPFSGGVFDIFGVTFNIAGPGGYVGEIWSNGYLPDRNGTMPGAPGYVPNLVYAAALANATSLVDNPNAGADSGVPPGRFGTFTTTPTPEPASLVLFGIGLLGVAALWVRRRNDGASAGSAVASRVAR